MTLQLSLFFFLEFGIFGRFETFGFETYGFETDIWINIPSDIRKKPFRKFKTNYKDRLIANY